jgi:hypothetical protein
MTPIRIQQRPLRAREASRNLSRLWKRIRAEGIDLAALLDLRAESRAYSYDCPDSTGANLAIALENAAEALYRDRERPDPRRPREAIVRDLDDLVARIGATVHAAAA